MAKSLQSEQVLKSKKPFLKNNTNFEILIHQGCFLQVWFHKYQGPLIPKWLLLPLTLSLLTASVRRTPKRLCRKGIVWSIFTSSICFFISFSVMWTPVITDFWCHTVKWELCSAALATQVKMESLKPIYNEQSILPASSTAVPFVQTACATTESYLCFSKTSKFVSAKSYNNFKINSEHL